jgi:serine/threonine-protein kinase
VHHDIKPSNLRLSGTGLLKILDLGVASCVTDEGRRVQPHGVRLGAVGTIAYMAPEQIQGRLGDARSDIYSAGAVLYEMSTGRRMFGSQPDVRRRRDGSTSIPEVPRQLERAIVRAIDPDAEKRFASALEMRTALARLVDRGGRVQAIEPRCSDPGPTECPASAKTADKETRTWSPSTAASEEPSTALVP